MPDTVLVVDDEPDLVNLLRLNLRRAGWRVVVAASGDEALALIPRDRPDAIVLDVLLPGLSGFEVCAALKGSADTAEIPILLLTAKAEQTDKLTGLERGADDYMTKPFDPRELVLRVKALLRRRRRDGEMLQTVGEFVIDSRSVSIRVAGRDLHLTPIEFKLLAFLIEQRGRTQSQETLLTSVWGYKSHIDTRTVTAHVRRLREKLGDYRDHIETIRHEGYRFVTVIERKG